MNKPDAVTLRTICLSDITLRPFNDSTYRRGYIHGLVAAVDALDAGATRQQIAAYLDDLNANWRAKDAHRMVIPPSYSEWKTTTKRRKARNAK
jgi:hypothetical protein